VLRVVLREIATSAGLARAHLHRPGSAPSPAGRRAAPRTLVLGHGAGGGIESPDLCGLTALTDDGWQVALVEQPWRVAGRRVATPPATLDRAWLAVLAALASTGDIAGPVVVGGRSAGARVACRTATQLPVAPLGVLCLAFPLRPPHRPDATRAPEALAVTSAGIPLAVVQGVGDPFGTPAQLACELGVAADVFSARGRHGFTPDPVDAVQLARDWLLRLAG